LIPQSIAETENGIEAAAQASAAENKVQDAVVIELFTSQGCYSCPPAEALLRKLSQRPDVIALEFHVDYWDDLVYGFSGKWQDRFSSPKATTRQADYNLKFRGKPNGYTPQVVLNGQIETVGTRANSINTAIKSLKTTRQSSLTVTPTVTPQGDLNVALNTLDLPGHPQILFVRFIKRKETKVTSGENMGKTLTSYNIAKEWFTLNSWNRKTTDVHKKIPPLKDNEGCAVLVQDRKTHAIHAAGFCRPAT